MKYFFIIIFQFTILCVCSHLPAQATPPAPEKKREKENKKNEQREEVIMVVDIDIPAGKSQEKIDEDNTLLMNQKWEKYLSAKIAEIQQLFNDISLLDPNTVTKECIEDYQIEISSLKEKVDFKLGNDPLWKENDELDEMRAQFSEIHAHTLKKIKSLEEKMTPGKTTNKWIVIGISLLAVMAIVPIFSQIKAAVSVNNAKKQAKKMMQQQKREEEKQRLLADESNIINIK
jgi:hypothetical protein